MKRELTKKQVQEKIESFFQRSNFSSEEVKKIKRLAMKYKIRLGEKRKLFCKKCLNKLEGKIRTSKTHKIIECKACSYKNKLKIN